MWQERPQSIVMVAKLKEVNQSKCHQYWPVTGTKSFGPFEVSITDQEILADYTTRNLSVEVYSWKILAMRHFILFSSHS